MSTMTPDPTAPPPDSAASTAEAPNAEAPNAEAPNAEAPAASIPDDPAFEARVVRAFIRGDRLVSMPARARKKGVILRYLLERVFPDLEPVDEREVNMRIALWHPDVSALRRYLVDARLVSRTGMVYRRAVPLPERASPLPERPGGPPFV
jgi:hypothetical protein